MTVYIVIFRRDEAFFDAETAALLTGLTRESAEAPDEYRDHRFSGPEDSASRS